MSADQETKSTSAGLFTSLRVPWPPGTSRKSRRGQAANETCGSRAMPFAQCTGPEISPPTGGKATRPEPFRGPPQSWTVLQRCSSPCALELATRRPQHVKGRRCSWPVISDAGIRLDGACHRGRVDIQRATQVRPTRPGSRNRVRDDDHFPGTADPDRGTRLSSHPIVIAIAVPARRSIRPAVPPDRAVCAGHPAAAGARAGTSPTRIRHRPAPDNSARTHRPVR